MKDGRKGPLCTVLSVLAILALASAAAFAVIHWWDELTEACGCLKKKCCALCRDGSEDYAEEEDAFEL